MNHAVNVMEDSATDVDVSRRKEERRLLNGDATIQVIDSKDPELDGLTIENAKILDASSLGLRLSCDTFLGECTIGVWVSIEGAETTMFLVTEVRWASWEEEVGYQVGVEVVDNPLAETDAWVDYWKAE